jgi:methenyltetrahydromethanopterin cyclohydrolase
MAAIDTLREIAAEVSALESMANSLDSSGVGEDFGWGLGMLLTHVCNDLAKLEKEILKETQ